MAVRDDRSDVKQTTTGFRDPRHHICQKQIPIPSDYSTLEGDQDNFELHLRELIKRDFGALFSKENINIGFHEIDDREICQVQISKGIKPTYLEIADKMGNKNKKFYTRSGNSSIEIQINEVTEYIKNRF